MTSVPKPAACAGCPLAGVGGFALGSGDPRTASLAICLENPWRDEIEHTVADSLILDGTTELARRERDYPHLETQFRARGVPAAGWTGRMLAAWGIDRNTTFVDNVLRCGVAPGTFPTGNRGRRAIAHCRVYDRWNMFFDDSSLVLVTLHPASLARDPTPTTLVRHDFERAIQLSAKHRVLLAAGQRAAQLFLPYVTNITRWRGHCEPYPLARWIERARELTAQEVRWVKITATFIVEEEHAGDIEIVLREVAERFREHCELAGLKRTRTARRGRGEHTPPDREAPAGGGLFGDT
jgi:hypothetical protein